MNAEQKQALIEDCQDEISKLERAIRNVNSYAKPAYRDEFISEYQSQIKRQQIALGALTAQPVAWGIKSQLDWLSGHKYLEADLFSQQRFDEVPLFTRAAPASDLVPKGWKLVPVEPTESMIVGGFESVPDEDFSEPEVWEAFQMMSGCQQAAHKARLCWSAMIDAAPAPNE